MKPELIISTKRGVKSTPALSKQTSSYIRSKSSLVKWKLGVICRPYWIHNDYSKTISRKGLRPDIVLLSRANIKIILVELSIPKKFRGSKPLV